MKLFILLLIPFITTSAQHYEHFFVVQKDGSRIEGTGGTIHNDNLMGLNLLGNDFSSPLSEIERLYISTGNKSVMMGGIGFLIGSVLGLSIAFADNTLQGDEVLVFVPAIGGTLIGLIIGSSQYSWQLIPLPQNSDIQLNFNFRRAL